MGCHNKVCNKFYHLKCVDLDVWPEGNVITVIFVVVIKSKL